MNPEPTPAANTAPPVPGPALPMPVAPVDSAAPPATPRWAVLAIVLALLALMLCAMLWQKLSGIQEQLARQSADSGALAVEARTLARQAVETVRETAARLAMTEARLTEVALHRSQLEELMQSLSRSRDENLVVDIESALRLAQQQAQLTGSAEPLLAALKTAEQRVTRAAQPRLTPLQRAIARDLDRVKAASVTDTPGLLVKLDELVRLIDELPTVVDPLSAATKKLQTPPPPADASDWQRLLGVLWHETRNLIRVSRIEHPEAVLLAPEQAFFLRENLKLTLLNARLGLLARQIDSARADLTLAGGALRKYFDPSSRKTQVATALLRQAQSQIGQTELPRVDETLTALATAAAGR